MNETLMILRVLLWPLTVLLIAILFRAELRKAIGRLVTVQYGDFHATFERHLKRAETAQRRGRSRAHLAASKPGTISKPAPGQVIYEVYRPGEAEVGVAALPGSDVLYRLSIVAPREAIARAWAFLERLVLDLARSLARSSERLEVQSWEQAIARLVDRSALPTSLRTQLEDLRALATKLAHTPLADPAITPDQARRYLDLVRELVGQMKPAARN